MPTPILIRAPFAAVPGSQASHYTVVRDFDALDINERPVGRTTVRVDTTEAARRKLQPIFPGTLTFKHAGEQEIPARPGEVSGLALVGDLYLQPSVRVATRLGRVIPQLAYPLTFAYLGISLDDAFFLKVVRGDHKRMHAFASGAISVEVTPPSAGDMPSFAAIRPGTNEVTLALGSRVTRYDKRDPVQIKDQDAAEVLKAPTFVPLPLAYWYQALMQHPDWGQLSALVEPQHANHPFFATLRAMESAQGRWRRIRCHWREERPVLLPAIPRLDGVRARAVGTKRPIAELWRQRLNVFGELFIKRPDRESFDLSFEQITDRTGVPVAPVSASDGGLSQSITLSWGTSPAPPSDPSPTELAVALYVLGTEGNPAQLNGTDRLYRGLKDHNGWTVNPDTRRVVLALEYVRPLQQMLKQFGIDIPEHRSNPRLGMQMGTFDRPTSWAVREFQIYAGMNNLARLLPSPVATYADTLEKAPNTQRYMGPVTGVVDEGTARALAYWRSNMLRCPVVLETRSKGRDFKLPAVVSNAWLITQNPEENARAEVRDLSGYYSKLGPPNTSADRIIAGFYDINKEGRGPISSSDSHTTWDDETRVTPRRLSGQALPDESPDHSGELRRAISTFKVLAAVAQSEATGVFDSVNAYDRAVVSVGVYHWVAYLEGGDYRTELPALLSLFASREPAEFERLFGRFGLGVERSWSTPSVGNELFRRQQLIWNSCMTQRGLMAKGRVDGDQPRPIHEPEDAEYLRTWHWFYRWVMAGRDSPAFWRIQWDYARLRLRSILDAPLRTGSEVKLSQLFSSEATVCMLLRTHVKFPGEIIVGGNASPRLRNVLRGQGLLTGHADPQPETWTQTQSTQLQEALRRDLLPLIGPSLDRALGYKYGSSASPLSVVSQSFLLDSSELV